MPASFTFDREAFDAWDIPSHITDPDEIDTWDPVDVGTEDSIYTLVHEAQRAGVITTPPETTVQYVYAADTDGGGYLWLVDLDRTPLTPKCRRCRREIEPDDENDWVHTEDGVAGCGKPFEDAEAYAEPALSTLPARLRLASTWEEQRKIVSRGTGGREAMIEILDEAVLVANALLGNLARWRAPEAELLRRTLPMLERLGDFIGNGELDPDRARSLGVRCDLILDIKKHLDPR